MKILLFIWYAYATGTHFGTHFEILGGTLFGTQFTEKSTLGPEKYLVTLRPNHPKTHPHSHTAKNSPAIPHSQKHTC